MSKQIVTEHRVYGCKPDSSMVKLIAPYCPGSWIFALKLVRYLESRGWTKLEIRDEQIETERCK